MAAKYIILDLETSGLSPYKGHGLLQCACLALDNNFKIIGQYNEYIKPPLGTVFDTIADSIHKIPREVTANGLTYEEFCEHFILWVKEIFNEIKPIMIGQFFVFDYNFLSYVIDSTLKESELIKDEKGQYGLFQSVLSRNFIDTKALVNIINASAELSGFEPIFEGTSLSKKGGLKDALGISQQSFTAHDALDDCRATREVLIRLIKMINIEN
jgi:DNA polymerase III epsilon subunit-like protein